MLIWRKQSTSEACFTYDENAREEFRLTDINTRVTDTCACQLCSHGVIAVHMGSLFTQCERCSHVISVHIERDKPSQSPYLYIYVNVAWLLVSISIVYVK